MLISNLRASAGLVNGALGKLVALWPGAGSVDAGEELRGRPTYVPVQPVPAWHRRMKQWTRLQLPLTLAWGITIHKSQGLTLPDSDCVDFTHQPTYQPVAKAGLTYVGMS